MSAVLSKQEIEKLLRRQPPLIEGMLNPDEQLQPNGVDLTLRGVSMIQSGGRIAASNSQRVVSDLSPLVFDGLGSVSYTHLRAHET